MIKGFNFSGPKASITGIAVSVQNLSMTGKGVALWCLLTELVRAVSPYGWVDFAAKAAAVTVCLGAVLAPKSGGNSNAND